VVLRNKPECRDMGRTFTNGFAIPRTSEPTSRDEAQKLYRRFDLDTPLVNMPPWFALKTSRVTARRVVRKITGVLHSPSLIAYKKLVLDGLRVCSVAGIELSCHPHTNAVQVGELTFSMFVLQVLVSTSLCQRLL
jgi:hypothetical protein